MLIMTVAQTVLDVLGQMMLDRVIFTAFDVTQKVRETVGEDTIIEHRDVRAIVHNEYSTAAMPDYSQAGMIELNVSGNPQVIVYYPHDLSPYDHPKAIQPKPAGVVLPPDPDPTDGDSTDTVNTPTQGGADLQDDGSVICSFTTEDRINVPKSLLRKVNPTGGSYDFTTAKGDFVRGTNSDSRVRLSKAELQSYGINTDTVRISADETTDKISVSAVIDDSDD